jgi:hypothetical protein
VRLTTFSQNRKKRLFTPIATNVYGHFAIFQESPFLPAPKKLFL